MIRVRRAGFEIKALVPASRRVMLGMDDHGPDARDVGRKKTGRPHDATGREEGSEAADESVFRRAAG